jgi:hypothetical protein
MRQTLSFGIKIKVKNTVGYIIIILCALFILVFTDEVKWNKGECKCGGQWELVDVESKPDSIMVEYFYSCEKCDNTIYTHSAKHND